MSFLSQIFVRIRGDSKDLRQDLKKSERAIKNSSSRMSRALGGMKKAMGGLSKALINFRSLAIAGAVTGLAYLIKRNIDAADSIAKTADKIGMTTDALQELRHVADLAGVSQQSLDSSMERFVKRIGEAARGTGEAKKVYESLGIKIKDTSGNLRDQNEILGDVSDAMGGMTTQTERVATAAALFGRDGVAMVNMLRMGRDALEAAKKKAREYGIVIDEALLRKAEEAKDALTILTTQMKAQAMVMSLELAPALIAVAENLSSVVMFWGKLFGIIKKTREQQIEQQIFELQTLNNQLNKNITAQKKWVEAMERMGESPRAIDKQRTYLRQLQHELLAIAGQSAVAKKALDDLREKKGAGAKPKEGVGEGVDDSVKALGKSFFDMKVEGLAAMHDINQEALKAAANYKKLSDEVIPDLGKSFFDMKVVALAGLHDINQEAIDAAEKYRESIKVSVEETKVFDNELKTILKDIQFATEDWGKDFEDVLVQATKTGKMVFSDMADAIIADMQRMMAQKFITKPLFGFLSNLIGSFGGVGEIVKGVPGMQHGGRAEAWKPAIVGEKGPELFVPSIGGNVVSNKDLRRLGSGGVNVEQVINIFPGVREEIRREIDAARPGIMRDAVRAVILARNRGGDVRRALG